MNKDVSVGFLYPEDRVGGRFCVSLTRLLLVQNPVNHVLDVMSGPDLAKGRNTLVETFLKETTDSRLLMLDSDMVFTPKTVLSMLVASQLNKGVIGGYCVKSDGEPTTYALSFNEAYDDTEFVPVARKLLPENSLVKVDGTGAACLLIPRSVLEAMEYGQWFTPIGEDSEDLSFCRRLYEETKVPLYVHTGARFGHSKSVVLYP